MKIVIQKMALFGLVACGFVAQSASAYEIHVLSCRDTAPGFDNHVSASINYVPGQNMPGTKGTLVATVTRSTYVGPVLFGSYTVTERQSPAMGAPKFYLGRGFELELKVDAAPVQGGILAHLVAEKNGRRISEEMVCNFTR